MVMLRVSGVRDVEDSSCLSPSDHKLLRPDHSLRNPRPSQTADLRISPTEENQSLISDIHTILPIDLMNLYDICNRARLKERGTSLDLTHLYLQILGNFLIGCKIICVNITFSVHFGWILESH